LFNLYTIKKENRRERERQKKERKKTPSFLLHTHCTAFATSGPRNKSVHEKGRKRKQLLAADKFAKNQ
jgi:hypothetical protein